MYQQFRVYLSDGIGEVAQGRDPRAVRRVTGAAQRAVDRLDGITRGAHYDERNRVLVCQSGLHQQRDKKKIRHLILAPEKLRSGMYWFSRCNIRLCNYVKLGARVTFAGAP